MVVLETERLLLRRLEMADLDDLYALYRDPEMREYFPEGTLTLEETREELEWFLDGHPRHPELGLWATIHKESGQFIGRCGLLPWDLDSKFEVEVAFMIDKRFWNQGLATEAAAGIVRYAFDVLGRDRLVCLIEPGNVASERVAAKIGMAFEREGFDDKGPFRLFSMSR